MATFDELMEKFRTPGDEGLPETFADDLHRAYQDDLSVRDAAVKDREEKLSLKEKEIADRDNEVTRLKAVNYDLMVAAPKAGEPEEEKDTEDDVSSGIDSLFE